MKKKRFGAVFNVALATCAFGIATPNIASAADASGNAEIQKTIEKIEKRLADQERRLKAQQTAIARQAALIERQKQELAKMRAGYKADNPRAATDVAIIDASSAGHANAPQQTAGGDHGAPAAPKTSVARASAPLSPVGEASKPEEAPQIIQSLPEGLAVLTPQGHIVLTPSIEYTETASDRLVYRGVVIVPGLNLGEVEASTDDRSIIAGVIDARYGLTSRLEIEARIPLMFSDDRATLLSQGPNGSATQSIYISGKGLGDVELASRYQLNSGTGDWPVFVGNLRLKSDTGTGPFDVERDSAGIAQQVALGSGFWAVEGGLSMLKVTDPAVLFASLNYIYSLDKNIDQTIGTVVVGRVNPSDSISATLGFGFAVNPDFSFSLGYEHSHVFPQYTMLDGTRQGTTSFEVGALTLGMAYRIAPNMSLNSNFEFGVTHNAPDLRAVFSLPISY